MVFRQTRFNPSFVAILTLLLCSSSFAADETTKNAVAPGKVVSLRYTVTLPDGKVVHTNVEGHPIKYKHGDGRLLPALEAALVGLVAGDEKSVTLAPQDAYLVDDAAFQEVPLNQVPEDARVVGAVFRPIGARGNIRVAEIKETTAVLDFNHPLAGKTLTYDVTILAVE